MAPDRPFFHFTTAALQDLVGAHRDNPDRLMAVRHELAHRSSGSAVALRQDVDRMLGSRAAVSSTIPVTEMPPPRAEPAAPAPADIEWDAAQRAVIEAAATARLLVNAGPGTGKTEVACARVASLICRGVEPSNIWLMSFTRTAVHEIRNRIRALVTRDALAAAVRITTLDSQAWHLVQGFEGDAGRAFGSYDDTIRDAVRLLESRDEALAEYLASVEHVIVDEAQDLVGVRADLVETVLARVGRTCGITVLCDEAQAIYGFAESDPEARSALPLPRRLPAAGAGAFARHELTTVHRTESPSLRRIFTDTRALVRSTGLDGSERLRRVRADIERHRDGVVGQVVDQALAGRDDTLVLFRQRVEVLTASAYLWNAGVAHRLRMSGLPVGLPAWIGALLWDHDARTLTRTGFRELYEDRRAELGPGASDVDAMWRALVATGGTTVDRVDMTRLRAKLSRAQPPVGLACPEIGPGGPIIGTIHASKGREAGTVHLMLPRAMDDADAEDVDEEARVLFVGATRARLTLRTGDGFGIAAGTTESSGRCFRSLRPKGVPRAQIEFGRHGDVDVERQVAESLFPSAADAERSQAALRRLAGTVTPVLAQSDPADGFAYRLFAGDSDATPLIGVVSPDLNADLFEVSRRCGARGRRVRLPWKLYHLRSVGVRSVALAPDHPALATLHPPFCDSGFFLAPVVLGFTTVYFYDAN
jgi:hypothetical protein